MKYFFLTDIYCNGLEVIVPFRNVGGEETADGQHTAAAGEMERDTGLRSPPYDEGIITDF